MAIFAQDVFFSQIHISHPISFTRAQGICDSTTATYVVATNTGLVRDAGHHDGTHRAPRLVGAAQGVAHVVDGGVLVLAPPAPHRLWLVLGLLGADGTLGALVSVLPRGPVVPAAHTLRNALTTK